MGKSKAGPLALNCCSALSSGCLPDAAITSRWVDNWAFITILLETELTLFHFRRFGAAVSRKRFVHSDVDFGLGWLTPLVARTDTLVSISFQFSDLFWMGVLLCILYLPYLYSLAPSYRSRSSYSFSNSAARWNSLRRPRQPSRARWMMTRSLLVARLAVARARRVPSPGRERKTSRREVRSLLKRRKTDELRWLLSIHSLLLRYCQHL